MYGTTDIMKGAKIAIIGVGGGGNNAVNKMADDKMEGLTFILANTDIQVLDDSQIDRTIILGHDLTRGLGAGANPEVGEKAAQASLKEIEEAVQGFDLIFVTAGMGGGTGTGAAPIIAKAAKETGALVVGIVTTPFTFEGYKRMQNAEIGLSNFREHVDSIIIVSNDRLKEELGTIPLIESFNYSDAILKQAVRTITDLINSHSLINLDFADVSTVIKGQGLALIGVGRSSSENKAMEAALSAINSPILESSIDGASSAIVNIAGSSKSLSIEQAHIAIDTIKEAASNEVDVIFGVTINDALEDELVVSVIATGLNTTKAERLKDMKKAKVNKQDLNINKYKDKKWSDLLNDAVVFEDEEETQKNSEEKTSNFQNKYSKPNQENRVNRSTGFEQNNTFNEYKEIIEKQQSTDEFIEQSYTNEKLLEFDLFDEDDTTEFEGF